jgi:ribonuclease R
VSAGGTVALLDKRGRFLVAEPFFERGRRVVVERAGGRDRFGVGDLVLVRPGRGGRGHAKVLRRLGRPDVAADVLEALMLDRGLPRRFDPAVEREAGQARDRGGLRPDVARRDLTALPTFTVDPVTARDFDDAISAEALDDGVLRIWVHTADVGAFVAPGSLVDREAARRATSVYVPGRVEPMLPEALSTDACSLVPGQDRLAVTVEIDLEGAEVRRMASYRSRVRSDARLDYDRVDRIFAGAERAEHPWARPLEVAREAAVRLAARRARGSALELADNPEPEFAFDPHGHVVAAEATHHTESHRLIEHLMIAANEQVATLLDTRSVPALYRVHERPEPTAVRRLADQLASLGVATPPVPEQPSPSEGAELVAECSRLVDEHVRRTGRGRIALTFLVLRALKQAHYTARNLGHAGLGLARYCHFTSPIRRYPDLVCHRALLSAVGAGEEPPAAGGVEETGRWSSARERDALTLERDADRVARAFLLERDLVARGWERPWEGEVTGVIGAGAFVTFGDGYEGLLPVRRLRGDWWELNEEGTILHGSRSGRTIRLGDGVTVQVDRVETARGRVDLLPVELLEQDAV